MENKRFTKGFYIIAILFVLYILFAVALNKYL